MANIYPFRGYRYNKEIVGDLNKIVTQPYDKIDKEQREEYYQRSKYNIIRLILGKDGEDKNRYEMAADYLHQWINKGVLKKDNNPSIYAYWQEYEVNNTKMVRKGFVALGKLEGEEGVKAHENTMEGPKADRLNLLRATEANFGHIFMLYSDPERKINNLLNKAIKDRNPLINVFDDDGNRHLLWQITDLSIIREIQKDMNDKTLYIADGHHRYQTAVNYMNECHEKGWTSNKAEGFENRLMTFINIDDPGLSVLPTHRLVYGLDSFKSNDFLRKVAQDFTVKSFNNRKELYTEMKQEQDKHVFGFKGKELDKYHVLFLKDEEVMSELLSGKFDDWRKLDVVILHKAILERYLKIDEKALQEKNNLEYIRYREQALKKLKTGDYQAVFLLNPTKVSEVKEVADQGERMPQKSTDFYPKLLTGLVINKLEFKKQIT
ncbi:MAG TPA: DUF1015 domain-containing protein [Halanaerobiales bacterium]|nr:DUF1015 domain-containing protein [Halanaerobiales bacterium]